MPLPNQDATAILTNNGLRTQYGVLLPPGAKVAAYVRSTGAGNEGADAFLVANLCSTLAQGLARVRPGTGDFVVVLPGHVETVADGTTFSNALQAGTKILGVGRGANVPTFNFTAPGSQWLVNKPDVFIGGLRLNFNAGATVTSGVYVTGPDFGFSNNDVFVTGSTGYAQTIMAFYAGADRANVTGNTFRGLSSASASYGVIVQGSISDVVISDNVMMFPAVDTTGCMGVSGASSAQNFAFQRNTVSNTAPASSCAMSFGNTGMTGQVTHNTMQVLNGGAQVSGTTGIKLYGGSPSIGFFQNFVVNDQNKSGILQPVADT